VPQPLGQRRQRRRQTPCTQATACRTDFGNIAHFSADASDAEETGDWHTTRWLHVVLNAASESLRPIASTDWLRQQLK
jgi:hypothetical protein